MSMVMMLASEGKVAMASSLIRSVVYDPHGGRRAEQAAFVLDQMRDAPDGKPFYPDWSKFAPDTGGTDAEAEE